MGPGSRKSNASPMGEAKKGKGGALHFN